MMRRGVSLSGAALSFLLGLSSAQASFAMDVTGETTVLAELVPVRLEYPAGRIVRVLQKGEVVKVSGAGGHGDGMWVQVEIFTRTGDKVASGWIPASQTSFSEDMRNGRLKRPSGER